MRHGGFVAFMVVYLVFGVVTAVFLAFAIIDTADYVQHAGLKSVLNRVWEGDAPSQSQQPGSK